MRLSTQWGSTIRYIRLLSTIYWISRGAAVVPVRVGDRIVHVERHAHMEAVVAITAPDEEAPGSVVSESASFYKQINLLSCDSKFASNTGGDPPDLPAAYAAKGDL